MVSAGGKGAVKAAAPVTRSAKKLAGTTFLVPRLGIFKIFMKFSLTFWEFMLYTIFKVSQWSPNESYLFFHVPTAT
jgi:hypothetical protein